jgi:hypothetical protein
MSRFIIIDDLEADAQRYEEVRRRVLQDYAISHDYYGFGTSTPSTQPTGLVRSINEQNNP